MTPWELTGVRGIRVANECNIPVTINDRDPQGITLIVHNADVTKLPVEILQRDASALLSERSFDAVDLDPFGTPAIYIDAAVKRHPKVPLYNGYRHRTIMWGSPESRKTPILCATHEHRIS